MTSSALRAQILVDNPSSWVIEPLKNFLNSYTGGAQLSIIFGHEHIAKNDVLFLVGCEKILRAKHRALSQMNLLVHESQLPSGRGWSPMTWQVLEGKNEICVSLLEVAENVDSGPVYARKFIIFEGHELIDEIRHAQIRATWELIIEYLDGLHATPEIQKGVPTYFPKRTPQDSRLDPNKTIAEQFNLLRVVDNSRYPAFFEHLGQRYVVRITKEDK